MAIPLLPTSTAGRVFRSWKESSVALSAGLGAALLATVPPALLSTVLDTRMLEGLPSPPGQDDVVRVLLTVTAQDLGVQIFWGPLVAAIGVFVMKAWLEGKPTDTHKALNFALNRYAKIFLPHLAASLTIMLGMVICVPGLMFLLMYAFVDPVACLEEEKWPLGRSTKLTKGRRASLFWLALPWMVIGQATFFVDQWAAQFGHIAIFATNLLWQLFAFWTSLSFVRLYLDRVEGRKKAAAAAADSPPVATEAGREG